jgi:hypothetical protein
MARGAKRFGLILGTLGRQGNPDVYRRTKELLRKHGRMYVQFLMAEIAPQKLFMMKQIDVRYTLCGIWHMAYVVRTMVYDRLLSAGVCVSPLPPPPHLHTHTHTRLPAPLPLPLSQAWVQVACPRLSIDWGSDLPKVCVEHLYVCMCCSVLSCRVL